MTEQEKREKIINRLEYCAENKCDICQEENGSGFPFIDGRCYGFTERLYDALALLKTQEAKPPIIKENSYGWKFYYCPSCGKEFYQNNKFSFCEKCGQAVKWDA